MDDIVRQAMLKWPNVPACYGWLGLDARGDWYMRDDRTQALGGFASCIPGAKGSRLEHEGLIAFIGRNYSADAQGRWYFQNGPQRVYVELEITPWVLRLEPNGNVVTHTGRAFDSPVALTDDHGWLYLQSSIGIGVVHSQDVGVAAERIAHGDWTLTTILRKELTDKYGFVASPARDNR